MNDTALTPDQLPKRSNTTLWLLLASFLIPAFLAYGFFFFGDRPSVASNGKLINPIIDIESLKLSDDTGRILSREELTPKWRMYYFAGASCDETCESNLYDMRQVNIALGKNQDRVQHVVVHLNAPDLEFMTLLGDEHKETVRVYASEANTSALSKSEETQSYIYLVDPLGNIMMKFPDELNAKLILKDINKLLKISRIG